MLDIGASSRFREQSPNFVAKRAGRGGGYVIDLVALPPEAQAEIARRAKVAQIAAQDEADALEADKRQMVLRASVDLTGRQRQVMEARAKVLASIVAIEVMSKCRSRAAAITAYLEAVRAGALTKEEMRQLEVANDKAVQGPVVSGATLYAWFSAHSARGVIALAPFVTRQKDNLPDWFDGFLKVYARPSKPSIAEALREFCKALPEGAPHPTAKQVRSCFAKLPVLERIKGREGRLAMRLRMARRRAMSPICCPRRSMSRTGRPLMRKSRIQSMDRRSALN